MQIGQIIQLPADEVLGCKSEPVVILQIHGDFAWVRQTTNVNGEPGEFEICIPTLSAVALHGMLCEEEPAPLNALAHDLLVRQGYTRTHEPARWEECGDAENGPDLDGHDAYDRYERALSPKIGMRFYVTESGIQYAEKFDLEMEEMFSGQQG